MFGAATGEEGLEFLNHNRMDAAIIDMRLPGMDGNGTTIRVNQIQPDLRFIIHTGSTDYHLPAMLQERGIGTEVVFLHPLPDLSVLAEAIRKQCKQDS